jgi:hypothetical protein
MPVVPRERVGLVESAPIPARDDVYQARDISLSDSEKAALQRRLVNAVVAEKRLEERKLSDDEFLRQLGGSPRAKRVLLEIAQ